LRRLSPRRKIHGVVVVGPWEERRGGAAGATRRARRGGTTGATNLGCLAGIGSVPLPHGGGGARPAHGISQGREQLPGEVIGGREVRRRSQLRKGGSSPDLAREGATAGTSRRRDGTSRLQLRRGGCSRGARSSGLLWAGGGSEAGSGRSGARCSVFFRSCCWRRKLFGCVTFSFP